MGYKTYVLRQVRSGRGGEIKMEGGIIIEGGLGGIIIEGGLSLRGDIIEGGLSLRGDYH